MSARTQKSPKLSREAWLEYALEVLSEEGIQGVRVERLARDLGVTKGSFYWHFHDVEELRVSILQHWDRQYTDVIVENREFLQNPDAAAGLWAAIARVREDGLDKYELAMRGWADHDAIADKHVAAVYDKRAKFIRGFFTRLGFRGHEAEVRARSTLCYLCWEPRMFRGDSETKQMKLLNLQHQILTARES